MVGSAFYFLEKVFFWDTLIHTLIFISPNGSITGDYVENENRAPSPNIQLSLSVLKVFIEESYTLKCNATI